MQTRKLTEILLAIVAVWQLLEAAPTLAYLLSSAVFEHPGLPAAAWSSIAAGLVVRIALSAAVLVWRRRVAEWLAPDGEAVSGEAHDWQPAALAVLGAYFVVRGASGTLGALVRWPLEISWASWNSVGSDVVQAVLGGCLFLGASGLSRVWRRLRTAGVGRRAA